MHVLTLGFYSARVQVDVCTPQRRQLASTSEAVLRPSHDDRVVRGSLSRYSKIMVLQPPSRPPGGRPRRSESSAEPERVRVELILTREDYDRLTSVANDLGLNVGEVIQRSIATALFLQEQLEKGSKILIEDRNGRLSEFTPD